VADPAVFVTLSVPVGGVQAVEALAVMFATPVAEAVAVLLRVVQAMRLAGTVDVVTVTVPKAPGASVPAEQFSVPPRIEHDTPV
jgi:hypothetical protein